MTGLLAAVDHSWPYRAALVFYGTYPILMALLWVVMSLHYARRRERIQRDPLEAGAPDDYHPFVSVIVPAYAEEATLAGTLEALERLDYPAFEVIVVNDGSPDATAEVARSRAGRGPVRLLDKRLNEGKAMALNDALPLCRGEILLVVDADIVVTPGLLRALVPHFLSPRVGAVTGNPRVANRGTLLADLQTVEFSAIIGLQRRAQRVWGRVCTVSGAVMAVRRTALIDAGLFSPDMATEDIDLTWKLQKRYWDVRYEARAVVWMQAPPTLVELWKQRRRWARGLAQVLRRHADVLTRRQWRRLWPVFLEASVSIVWAYTFVLVTAYWAVSLAFGYHPAGASPIPNFWGMTIGTACLVQLLVGALTDRQYDRSPLRHFGVAVLYPVIYWMLMSVITFVYTPAALVRRGPRLQTWKIRRVVPVA